MLTEFTSLTGVDQRQVFDEIISDLRSTVLLDENKIPHNMEVIVTLGLCKILQSTDHTRKYSINWRNLGHLLTDAEYFTKMHMDTANFPRGQTTYRIVDIEEDVTINTVVEMDGTPMLESKINDIITTIYDGEHILLPANAKALEIIKKRTNPAGMMNRHYVFQSSAILHQMMLEMQVPSQALGSMDVMTRAQEDFSVLINPRKIQNQAMSAYDIRLQRLLQGSQLSTGTAEQSL